MTDMIIGTQLKNITWNHITSDIAWSHIINIMLFTTKPAKAYSVSAK